MILDGVFEKFISTNKIIFKVGKKVTSIVSVDAFIIITGHYALALKSEVYAGISFRKVKAFTINRRELCHIFP